jgi:hypothetical protein
MKEFPSYKKSTGATLEKDSCIEKNRLKFPQIVNLILLCKVRARLLYKLNIHYMTVVIKCE